MTQIAQGVSLSTDEVEQIADNARTTPEAIEQIVDARVGDLVIGDLSREVISVGGTNIFNVDDPGVTLNRFVNENNGSTSFNSTHIASHFIGVIPGEDLYVSLISRYAFYDADQNYISGELVSRAAHQIVVPADAVYFRFSVNVSIQGFGQIIVARSDSAVPFEPYTEPLISGTQIAGFTQLQTDVSELRDELDQAGFTQLQTDVSELRSELERFDDSFTSSVNVLNPSNPEVSQGRFVNETNGNTSVNADHIVSHFIEVTPGEDLYVSSATRYVFYDADQNYISGDQTPRTDHQLVVPANAAFFRFSVNVSSQQFSQIIVARSDTEVPFQPHQSETSIISLTPQGQRLLDPPPPPVDLTRLLRLQANLGNRNTWELPENVLYIGDSFWNDGNDIAAEAIRASGIPGDFSLSIAGSTLSQIPSVLNEFDTEPFDTIVIGRGTNDQLRNAPLEAYQDRILAVLGYFLGRQIILVNLPPLGHFTGFNAAFLASLEAKNAWLETLFDPINSSLRTFDINSVLDTNGDNRINDELSRGGTDIHANPEGSRVAALALVERFQP